MLPVTSPNLILLPFPRSYQLVHPSHLFNHGKFIMSFDAPIAGKLLAQMAFPQKIIAEFAYELSVPVTHIINASFSQIATPKRWKRAIIVPISKKPKPSIEDLRPVSLTDHFSKITENFISRLLISSIDPPQCGNRKGNATAHYLIDVLNAILRNADKPKTVSTLLAADFSKAFDRIKHNIAVTKMLEMNAPPVVVAWICSFLSDREQCVRYMSTLSEWEKVTAGAPQGTLLGPGHLFVHDQRRVSR